MAMLLGSRGRSRSRSGWLQSLTGMLDGWLGKSMWKPERPARTRQVPGWIFAVGVLGAFAGGYVVGGRTDGSPESGLHTKSPDTPAMLGEFDTKPLSSQAFVVAAYAGIEGADAKARAKALAEFLRSKGLARTRPYFFELKQMWVVAVYYENDTEFQATQAQLLALPAAVPDDFFVQWRKTEEKWPLVVTIQ